MFASGKEQTGTRRNEHGILIMWKHGIEPGVHAWHEFTAFVSSVFFVGAPHRAGKSGLKPQNRIMPDTPALQHRLS